MVKRGVRLFTIIISFIMLLSITDTVFAKNNNKNNGNKHQTKNVLVKYRSKDTRREEKLNEKKNKLKLKRYQKVNKNNLYSIEVEESELEALLEDIDIELVEEDSIIQLLCDEYQNDAICYECNHDINIFGEHSCEDTECIHIEHTDTEHTHTEHDLPEEHWIEGLCLLCLRPVCDEVEECIDTTHYICNDCIREMLEELNSEEVSCSCGCQDKECTCHELCETGDTDCTCECEVHEDIEDDFWKDYIPCCDTCSFECVNNPCCDNCIFGDIYYQRYEIFERGVINGPVKELEVGNELNFSPLGDKIYWNILRTKSDLLHDKNIKGSGIRVAVFDTGVDLYHDEINVVGGVSFIEGVTSYDDDNGHGTAMAGILAAKLNGQGMVGIAPEVDLYSVKVLDKDGIGRYSHIIQGIEWAIDNNINIISLSLGSNQYSQILEEAINLAIENNILIVAAAGNGGDDNIMYPAAYPQVICVGATDSTNSLATFSNYGFQLDLVAPGDSIVTTGLNNFEVTVNGTSPATQHVAGVAALLWSADRNLTNGHIKYLLYRNAYALGEYNLYGHGLPDAELSLKNLEYNDYSIYIDDDEELTPKEELVDVGWDGVVYGQACNHNFVYQYTTAPTCTTCGYWHYKCSKCGATRNDEIPPYHSWVFDKTIAPKCNFDGCDRYKCMTCGTTEKRNPTPKLGHDLEYIGITEPKCEKDGKYHYKCRRCSAEKNVNIPMLGCNYVPVHKSPTCTDFGYDRIACSRCGSFISNTRLNYLGHDWVYDNQNSTCTEVGYALKYCSRCPEYTLSIIPASGHSYSSYVSPIHTSSGHYWSSGCSRCGYGSSSGYQTLSTCLSCTTAPSVSFANMSGNTVLCETDTSFKPQIKVFDNENDTLTCKYHLDGSSTATGTMSITGTKPEKTVAFTTGFNAANLTEGNHTIKATVKDSIAPMGETTITFKVDKSAPAISNLVITPTTNNVKFTVTASDTISGLASEAYRYTVNGVATGWLAAGVYTKTALIPNTSYSYIVEVRDNKGHIATKTGSFNTNVENPVVSLTTLHENKIQIVISDNNPASTQYRIKVGSGYVNASGIIVSGESWITIPYDTSVNAKMLVLSNLSPNTSYTVTASARNTAATETATGTSVTAVTTPAAPINIATISITHEQIDLQWQAVTGAVKYEVYRETLNEQGNVIEDNNWIITSNYLSDIFILPNQNYQYKIRSINSAGFHGIWSLPIINVKTPPTPPEKVSGVNTTYAGTELDITWNEILGAVGYKVEVVCNDITTVLYSVDNHELFDTEAFNSQCSIKVMAFNQCNEDEPNNPSYWANKGEWSDTITLYTPADIPTMQPIVLDRITPTSITVSWNVNNNQDSVRYMLNISQNDLSIREIQVTGTDITDNMISYQVTGLVPETLYVFSVKAINLAGEDTDWSNLVEAATLMNYPGVPVRLRATAKSDIITLTWDASDHAQGYQIEKNGLVIEYNYLGTNYMDLNVEPDSIYEYRVKAINATGESDWSQNLFKKTLGRVPSSPIVNIVTGSAISVTLEWSSSEEVSGYEIDADGHIYNMGMSTVFEHNGLIPGTVHTYAVRSRSVHGKSEWSDYVTFTTKPLLPDIPVITQAIPTESSVTVYWNVVTDTQIYEIEIDSITVGITSSLGYQFEFMDNISDTEHVIRLRAVNESGAGGWSIPYPFSLLKEGEGGGIPMEPIPVTPGIACSVTGPAIIFVNWDQVQGATYYQLEADNSIIYTGGETRFIHTGLTPNNQYQYRVRAGNLSGESQWSETVTAYIGSPSSMEPRNISYYRIDEETTKIIWDQVAYISEYAIEVNGAVSGSAITATNTTIHTEPGSLYSIRVASVRVEDGTEVYEWSDEVTFRTSRRLPAIPDNISSEASSDTITLSWEPISDAQGYEIDSPIGIIDVGVNVSYMISGLDASDTYSLKVRAYNEAGHGEWSQALNIMTKGEIPGVPINIRYSSYQSVDTVTGSAIRMQWESVQGASSYEIEDIGGTIYTTDTNDIIIGGLIAGHIYRLRVRAINDDSVGAWSSRISVTPVIEAPNNVTVVIEGDKVKVSWDPVSIDDEYEIEIDGVVVATTNNLSYEFDYQIFYMQRKVRVRALRDDSYGDWSKAVDFVAQLPIVVNSYNGEIFSVIFPTTNVEIGNYKLTLSYNLNEVELVDACEMTAVAELISSYIEEFDIYIIIERDDTTESITYIVGDNTGLSYTGVVNSLRLRSKVSGAVNLHYGVTLR